MTVKDLIDRLSQVTQQEMPVFLAHDSEGNCFGEVSNVVDIADDGVILYPVGTVRFEDITHAK